MPDIYYYPRGSNELRREVVYGGVFVGWAYRSAPQPWGKRLLFRYALASRLGWWMKSRLSRGRIRPAIKRLGIDETEFLEPTDRFRSFNEFFIRRLKPECRPADPRPEVLVSPADARTLVYPQLAADQVLPVKGASYSVDTLLGRPAPEFHGGAVAVLRLCPADYHRFHFPTDGRISEERALGGWYHSVNPAAIATGLPVFTLNRRLVTVLETPTFGRLAFVAVGAFGVGRIVTTWPGGPFRKMDEKGYFEFGGSTIVLVAEPGRARFAADLVANSAQGYETLIKAGSALGEALSTA